MHEILEQPYQTKPEQSELGQSSNYDSHYNPERLFAIPREFKRTEIGVDPQYLPFYGFDCWNHYEVSWLNEKGKPIVALAEIIYSGDTTNIIESKSMKLYFNSFNHSMFKNADAVAQQVKQDLMQRLGHATDCYVRITPVSTISAGTVMRCSTVPRAMGNAVPEALE